MAGQMTTSLKFKSDLKGITFEVFFCLNIIVHNTRGDKIGASQHPISWLWLRKEMQMANIYGGGSDTLRSRKLWKWLKCACFSKIGDQKCSDKHLPFLDP